MDDYTWHGHRCRVLARAPHMRGVKRNALIELEGGERLVVPARSLRVPREYLGPPIKEGSVK